MQDRCIAAPGLIAEIIDNRLACHLPNYRQAEMFARIGVNLHRRTLCDWTLLASDWLAIIYTIVENCRRLGINPKEYLTDVLTRLPGMLAKDAVALTPANWLKARNRKPQRMAA